jgi:hypothetical protein
LPAGKQKDRTTKVTEAIGKLIQKHHLQPIPSTIAPPSIGDAIEEIPETPPTIPVYKGLFLIGVHSTRSASPPAMIAELANPQIARPSTKTALTDAVAQIAEPTMKIKTLPRKMFLAGRVLYNLPNMNWKLHMQSR